MILDPPKCFWLALFTFTLISNDCVGQHQDSIIKRALVKSWRKKAEEYKVRLFDRLPTNEERSYTPPQVIKNRGYPVEIHQVTTDDGYVLELHRIPPNSSTTPKKVVFLQHGVLQNSGVWTANPTSRSLAFLLADRSYDVWLGNFRGNTFSRRHTTLNPSTAEFWKFSWDELGNHDITSSIDYVLKFTGQPRLSYIGYSLGSAAVFMGAVKHQDLNSKIDIVIALAPLSTFAHAAIEVLRVFAPWVDYLKRALDFMGVYGWFDTDGLGDQIFKSFCEQTRTQAQFCIDYFYNIFVGPSKNLDPDMIPLFNANLMRGTSVKVIAQFAQNYNAGNVFQAYDFGRRGNLLRYGSVKPLEYDLAKITAPVYVFSGGSDHLVTPLDVDWLLSKLKNLNGSNRISDYSHLDFVWGIDVKEKLYEKVIALLPPP
ncbi:gastric triacylglycerol lipase isoform X3 [Daphnia magna]|uniref:gastric triacylglycerol lipase isoform X3 n=1 Tax=Daphnia magna TaxID=35525 RepID=UPI001E1BDBD1|nr:gastric triacylglycerol lipase isoform X3 [Daphnia magna]